MADQVKEAQIRLAVANTLIDQGGTVDTTSLGPSRLLTL